LSLSNVFALFLSLSTHTRRTRIHREEIIEIHRDMKKRGREGERWDRVRKRARFPTRM
jgi:hypothetical protein